jgi:DNA-binding MarR family transcriptional regulator
MRMAYKSSEVQHSEAPEGHNSVRFAIGARRLRARYLPANLFADPAWDLLLNLYLAQLEQRRVAVSALFASGGVPQSTNFRWLSKLESEGLVQRTEDPLDARRAWVSLTESAANAMRAYFGEFETLASEFP